MGGTQEAIHRDRLLERDLSVSCRPFSCRLFSPFGISPPLMSKVATALRRVYREASAAWHVSPRVTGRLVAGSGCAGHFGSRDQKKEGVSIAEHPRNRWDGDLPLLAALFLSTLLRHSSSLKFDSLS
jgi:hypothetical protein